MLFAHAQPELKRLEYRMRWEDALRAHLNQLKAKKPVILCGDLNVAHEAIDLKHPERHLNDAGYSEQERAKFNELLENGYIDTFRWRYPDKIAYSWWDYRYRARLSNSGWRIDYVIVSDRLKERIIDARVHTDILGSDHCPISLDLRL